MLRNIRIQWDGDGAYASANGSRVSMHGNSVGKRSVLPERETLGNSFDSS